MNRDISTSEPSQHALAPYALILQGTDHQCPIPKDIKTYIESPFVAIKEKNVEMNKSDIWATDGSSFYIDGTPFAGFAAIRLETEEIVQGRVKPPSAQLAEIIAVAAVMERIEPDTNLLIIMDSQWVLHALIDWLPIWLQHDMKSADNKPVAHAIHLKYIWDLAIQSKQKIQLCKIKAHTKGQSPLQLLNKQVDLLAKEACTLNDNALWTRPYMRKVPLHAVHTRSSTRREKEAPYLPDVITLQATDKEIQRLLAQGKFKNWNIYQANNDLIMARNNDYDVPVIVMPQCLRHELITLAHNQGHFGSDKVQARILNVAWWPNMTGSINDVIHNCLQCAANNPDTRIIKGQFRHQQVVAPWKRIQLDYVGPLPTTARGFKYALVIIDSFTKWIEAYPTRNNTALTTAKKLINEAIARFGIPEIIDSDQGPHFIGETVKHLSIALGIDWKLHIAGHPQASGLVERSNRTLKTAMRKMVNSSGKNWDVHLPLILMSIRSTIGSHGFTPHEIMIGRKMRTPEHWWVQGGAPPDGFQQNIKMSQWVEQLLNYITEMQLKVAHQLGANQEGMDKRLDHKFKYIEWDIGTKVLYKWFSETGHVLGPKWVGPYPIVNKASPTVYQLAIKDHKGAIWLKWFHSSQLKQWKGNPNVNNHDNNPLKNK